jgi:hypothetical protein
MIRRIPDCFFSGCWRLSLIRIPSRVESIGKSAFERCSQLTSISLPDACAQIGDSAFASSGLTQIYLSNGEVTIHPEAFNDILGETFEFLPRSSGQVLNLQYIPDRGFANSRSLEAVTVPQSVVSIGNMAFFGCRSLQSICLCNVLQLRDGVFVDCGLRSINVSRVRNFGKRIFKGCPRLMDITLPRGLSVDNIPDQDNVSTDRFPEFTVSPDTFYGVLQDCKAIVGVRKVQLLDLLSELCTELREYKPDVSYQNAWISGVTDSSFTGTIEPNVFSENSVLKYAYFERASGIGKVAFGSCLSLRAVKMPAVKHVWQSAFWACPGLDTVIISHDATYHSDKDASMQLCACAPTSPSTEKSPKYNQFIFSQNVTKYVILAPFASPEECSQIKVIADTRIGELFPAWGGPEKQLIVTDRID